MRRGPLHARKRGIFRAGDGSREPLSRFGRLVLLVLMVQKIRLFAAARLAASWCVLTGTWACSATPDTSTPSASGGANFGGGGGGAGVGQPDSASLRDSDTEGKGQSDGAGASGGAGGAHADAAEAGSIGAAGTSGSQDAADSGGVDAGNRSILEPATGALLGLYYGDESLAATTTKLGRTVPIHLVYYAWDDDWTAGSQQDGPRRRAHSARQLGAGQHRFQRHRERQPRRHHPRACECVP